MSATTIIIAVREDSESFHGKVAHVAIQGDGGPAHFAAAVREAMKQAGANLPAVMTRSTPPVQAPAFA